LILPGGTSGGVKGFGAPEAPAVLHHSVRPISLIGRVRPRLDFKVLL